MRNREREDEANRAFYNLLPIVNQGIPETAIILGTGWGDALDFEPSATWSLSKIAGFDSLGNLEGHKRRLLYGNFQGRKILVLSGRIHINESPASAELHKMVRLQVEMLFKCGVKNLILTNAAGSLDPNIKVGDIVVADGFITVFAPEMPLWGGEFVSPEDSLDAGLREDAISSAGGLLDAHLGAYAMVRGPFFEGRRYDKKLLKSAGASVVGMSTLPEACVAALYKEEGVRVVCVSFVTNTDSEEHSHEENMKRAKESSSKLGKYLGRVVAGINAD